MTSIIIDNKYAVHNYYNYYFLFSVFSFVDMAKYLLSKNDGLFLLSEKLNQDPLESYFGKQRARCGRSDNPNSRTFLACNKSSKDNSDRTWWKYTKEKTRMDS